MKIAMMTNNYKPFIGGVPISVERLADGLRKLGHEVCVFAPEYEVSEEAEKDLNESEEEVVRFRSHKKKLSNGMVFPGMFDPRIRQEFKKRNFDLIHVHQPMVMGNMARYYSRRYEIPLVFTWHTRYEEYLHYLSVFSDMENGGELKRKAYEAGRKLVPWYMKNYADGCDLVFAPSGDMERYMRSVEVTTPVMTLPTGLSDSSFVNDKEKSDEIRKRYLGEKKYLLCTVSRIEKEKNLYLLLDTVACLNRKMRGAVRMLVVGDGGERKALTEYCKAGGLEDTVIFIGGVSNDRVKDYLFASDLFVFTSLSETQGIVLAEAMAAGLPVAAVEACGVNDIVRDGFSGLLCPPFKKELAENIEAILTDRELYESLKKGAEKTAVQYREERVAKRAEYGYLSACESAPERGRRYGYEACEPKDFKPSVLRLFKMS